LPQNNALKGVENRGDGRLDFRGGGVDLFAEAAGVSEQETLRIAGHQPYSEK
jgi:hypothetical protein